MFGKIKQYATKKVLDRHLKDVPEDQKQLVTELVEKNPQLFEKIAKEIQAEMKQNGNNQMAAAMKVLPKYQAELQKNMSPELMQKLAQMQGGAAGKFNPNGSIRR